MTVVAAGVFGAELARSVIERSALGAANVDAIAAGLSLDAGRVAEELAYVAIVTMHFCVGAALRESAADGPTLHAFYEALWREPWVATREGLAARVREYEDAFNHPHPQYGRGYRIGQTFARHCGARHDVAVIELGARAYVEQLPPILDLLKRVAVQP